MNISEQVKELREFAKLDTTVCSWKSKDLMSKAADTIEALSAKLAKANMERSETFFQMNNIIKQLEEKRNFCYSEMEKEMNEIDYFSEHIFEEYHNQGKTYDESIKIIKGELNQRFGMALDDLKEKFPNMTKAIDQMFSQFKDSGITEKFLKISENAIEEYKAYKGIGTVEECRKAMVRSAADCGCGWIPCSERLPEKVGNYIIHVKTGTDEDYVGVWCYQRGVHLSGRQTYIDDKQGYWASPYNGDPINEPLTKRVVAWQPLPEPFNSDRS